MSKLERYIVEDSETQYDSTYSRREDALCEIYGVSNGGIIFERDLSYPNRILRHCSNGLKVVDYELYRDEFFFRKNEEGSSFFASYKDYDDFKYSEGPKELSEEEMIKVLKEYVYLHNPHIGSKTLMGWRNKDGDNSPINDPNWCNNLIQLDDKKDYTIIKRTDTVKLFEGDVSMYYFDDHDDQAIVKFKLDRNLYEKAMELLCIKRQIVHRIFGLNNTSLPEKYIQLQSEIKNELLQL